MRVNVYSQELTNEFEVIEKVSDTGLPYYGVRFFLHSSDRLHHTPDDDDRSAITFWLPKSGDRIVSFAQTLENIALAVRAVPAKVID